MQILAILPGYPPELDDTTLLLKIPFILIPKHRELMSELSRKLHP